MMTCKEFTALFREAFGEKAVLPLVFWYDDTAIAATEKIGGCFFKGLDEVRKGRPVSLNADAIGCGGGKFYTGFAPMPEFVPEFVSRKERYKRTSEMVREFADALDIRPAKGRFLNFARVDTRESFEGMEGILFYATPDVLSGLCAWAYFDNNAEDAVLSSFGSGCSSVVAEAVRENRTGGRRCFMGLFDISVRPYVAADELGFVIPASRFGEMLATMRECCLFGTHAWGKLRARIDGE